MPEPAVKTIAFYLPQFHPFEENDEWWGKGFTEWRNVVRARPMFDGHDQPREPGDLGFYDLRLPEVRNAQAALARKYGIYGFCYYYYWFSGRKVMNRPLEEMIESGSPDLPFCLCWANENWSRLWDGGNAEILLEQQHTPETDIAFINDVIPLFRDPRYIKVDGKPFLIIYRISLIADPADTVRRWRQAVEEAGFPGIHLCAVQSFGTVDPTLYGFDSAVEFPPHGYRVAESSKEYNLYDPAFRGKIYDYEAVMSYSIGREMPSYPLFRTAMLGWDNSARKRLDALIYHGCTPALFETWIGALAEQTMRHHPPNQRFLFVNAWNEWAEGTYLEPDLKWGHAYLEALARGLRLERPSLEAACKALKRLVAQLPAADRASGEHLLSSVVEHLDRLSTEVATLRSEERWARLYSDRKGFAAALQRSLHDPQRISVWNNDIKCWLETVAERRPSKSMAVSRDMGMRVTGWMLSPTILGTRINAERMLVLRNCETAVTYIASVAKTLPRKDVAEANPKIDLKYSLNAGFDVVVDLRRVPPGHYEVGVAMCADGTGAYALTQTSLEVL